MISNLLLRSRMLRRAPVCSKRMFSRSSSMDTSLLLNGLCSFVVSLLFCVVLVFMFSFCRFSLHLLVDVICKPFWFWFWLLSLLTCLSATQLELQSMAYNFGQTEMLPHAAMWDAEQHFPGALWNQRFRCCSPLALRFSVWFASNSIRVRGGGGSWNDEKSRSTWIWRWKWKRVVVCAYVCFVMHVNVNHKYRHQRWRSIRRQWSRSIGLVRDLWSRSVFFLCVLFREFLFSQTGVGDFMHQHDVLH